MDPTTLVAVIAAVAAPIGAYLLAARKMSGRIRTSDASDLWAESRDIREDYKAQLEKANERTSRLEDRVARLERTNAELVGENIVLRARVTELEQLVDTQRQTIAALERTIEAQRDELGGRT